jgi:hypothetical protein
LLVIGHRIEVGTYLFIEKFRGFHPKKCEKYKFSSLKTFRFDSPSSLTLWDAGLDKKTSRGRRQQFRTAT